MNIPMNQTAAKVATTYNAVADNFDAQALSFWDRCGHRTIELLNPVRDSRILDVGCGSGASALCAARRIGPKGYVEAIDVAEKLLGLGRRKAESEGLSNIAFQYGDMTNLPYADNSFDYVVSVFSIFFADDIVAQLNEFRRVLRRDGTIAVTTWGNDMFEPGSSYFWEAVQSVNPGSKPSHNPWERLTNARAIRRLTDAASLLPTTIQCEQSQQILNDAEDWWTICLGSGYRGVVDSLSRSDREKVKGECLESIRHNRVGAISTSAIFTLMKNAPDKMRDRSCNLPHTKLGAKAKPGITGRTMMRTNKPSNMIVVVLSVLLISTLWRLRSGARL